MNTISRTKVVISYLISHRLRFTISLIVGVIVVFIILILDNLIEAEFASRLTMLLEVPSDFVLSILWKVWLFRIITSGHLFVIMFRSVIDLFFYSTVVFISLSVIARIRNFLFSKDEMEKF